MRLIGGPRIPLLMPSGGAASAAPTWTKKSMPTRQSLGFATNTATFNSVAVNNASAADTIVLCALNSYGKISGITIGGDAMTKRIASGDALENATIWTRTGNIYTTPNIVATNDSVFQDIIFSVGVLTGVNTVPTSTAKLNGDYYPDPQQTDSSLTIPNPGFAIVVIVGGSSGATWNNGTEDYDDGAGFSSGYHATPGSFTPSISGFNYGYSAMAAATWGV